MNIRKLGLFLYFYSFFMPLVAQPIIGIGDVKIGMSESEFLGLSFIKGKIVKDFSARDQSFISEGGGFMDLLKKTKDSPIIYGDKFFSPGLLEYTFKMSIGVVNASRVDSYETKALFYNNFLVEITLRNPDRGVEDILIEKYGKPIVEDRSKKVICQNAYGARTEQSEGGVSKKWGIDNKIEAEWVWYSYFCGKNVGYVYVIRDRESASRARIEDNQAKAGVVSDGIKSKAADSKL